MQSHNLKMIIETPSGLIPLAALSKAIKNILSVLTEVNKEISMGKITTKWAIKSMIMKSPAKISIVAHESKENSNPQITMEMVINGMKGINKKARSPQFFNNRTLESARRLANLIDGKNISEVRLEKGEKKIKLNNHLVDNVNKLIRRKREQSIGAIDGKLDMINIHEGLRIGIYRLIDDRQIEALFENGMEMRKKIKSLLGKRVYAWGEIERNKDGEPVSIKVVDIESLPEKGKFSITDLYGIDPDFTDGLSVDEFLKRQRGER